MIKGIVLAAALATFGASAVAQSSAERGASDIRAELTKPPPAPSAAAAKELYVAPWSADEIRGVRGKRSEVERAAMAPLRQPVLNSRSIQVDASVKGAAPLVVIARGVGATLTFVDATGAPWPIERAVNFNDSAFEVLDPPTPGEGKTWFSLRAKDGYGYGNVNVMLVGLSAPLSIRVEIDSRAEAVDGRLEIRVAGKGPRAVPDPVVADTRPDYDPNLQLVLDGLPPAGARLVKVEGASNVAAYRLTDGRLILRTPLQITSPAHTGGRRDASGMRVYSLPWSPVVVASEDGRMIYLSIGQ